MRNTSPNTAPGPNGRLPAWILSIAFHSCTLILLAMAIQQAPRGAAEQPARSAGIVLKRTSAEGDVYEGKEDQVADAAEAEPTPAPQVQPPVQEPTMATIGLAAPQLTQTSAPANASGEGQPAGSTVFSDGGRHGSPDGDKYAKVSVFGVEGSGNKFVYVFDRSSSMEGPPLAAAKRQLVESLKSLDTVHQFHIIFFNHRLRSLDITGGGRRIAFGTERNKKLAANFIGGMTADGGTDRFAALKQALAFQPDVVFFLTDADDPMSASEMERLERLNSRIGAAICVIEFGRTAAKPQQNFLIELARQSGGKYGYVDTTKLKP